MKYIGIPSAAPAQLRFPRRDRCRLRIAMVTAKSLLLGQPEREACTHKPVFGCARKTHSAPEIELNVFA